MTTTTSVLSAPIQQSFSEKLLAVPTPYMIHNLAAERKVLPRNGGDTLRMRRYNPLPVSTVPLGNSGVEPPPTPLTAVNIDARIDYYGQYIILNEQVTLQAQDPVLNESAKRLGVALRQTEDELTRNMLVSTASQYNCVGGVNGDNPTELTRSDIDEVVRTLASNDAYTISDAIEGEDRFGTAPVRDAFFCMAFIAKNQYPNQADVLRPEWGAIGNTRWLLSSIGSVTASGSALGANVYNAPCVGMEAYAAIDQDGYSSQFLYRPPIYSGPLALNASVGWKSAFVPRLLNDGWVINIRSTAA